VIRAIGRAVIQTRGLSKQYRTVTALSDCSITVPEGRLTLVRQAQ